MRAPQAATCNRLLRAPSSRGGETSRALSTCAPSERRFRAPAIKTPEAQDGRHAPNASKLSGAAFRLKLRKLDLPPNARVQPRLCRPAHDHRLKQMSPAAKTSAGTYCWAAARG